MLSSSPPGPDVIASLQVTRRVAGRQDRGSMCAARYRAEEAVVEGWCPVGELVRWGSGTLR